MLKDASEMGMPQKLIRLIKMTIDGSKVVERTQERLPDDVTIVIGAFFNIALDGVIRACKIERTIIQISVKQISVKIIAYADDIAVVAGNKNKLKETVKKISRKANKK